MKNQPAWHEQQALTPAGQAAIDEFKAFINAPLAAAAASQADIEIPPNPPPPGGITATMLAKLRGQGPQVAEQSQSITDRMEFVFARIAAQDAAAMKKFRP